MTKKLLLYICLIVFFFGFSVNATTVYINCESDGSEDPSAADGSYANPWQSWSKVDGKNLADGSDVYQKEGTSCTLSSDVSINWSGVDANDISWFGCYDGSGDFSCDGARPIIQASNDTMAGFWIQIQEYIRFDYLDIRGVAGNKWQSDGSGRGVGTGITSYPDRDGGNGGKGHITVNNCRFWHWGHYAFGVPDLGDNTILTNNTVEECGNGLYPVMEVGDNSHYNYMARNTCDDIRGYIKSGTRKRLDGHCFGPQAWSYSILEDNTNTDAYAGAFGIFAYKNDPVQFNVFRNNLSNSSQRHSMMVSNSGGTTAYGNLLYKNTLIDSNSGTKSARETIRILDMGVSQIGNRVFNNTIYNGKKGGVTGKASIDSTHDHQYFYNNIIHLDSYVDSDDLFIRQEQNICSAKAKARGDCKKDGVLGNNLFVQYNLYWTTAGDPSAAARWQDTNLKSYTWAQWKARGNDYDALAEEATGIVDNPDFTNAPTDLTLTAGSPAINAGGYLSHVTQSRSNQLTVEVDDSYWFHGNYYDLGLTDENGEAVSGMLVTFYDETGGGRWQHAEVTKVDHGIGTGRLTVTPTIDAIYDSGNKTDPAYTTQISLRFSGIAPDIGAEEYDIGGGSKDPVTTITSPTSNSTYTISSTTVNLGGSASDGVGVSSSVTWGNDRGGSGNCTVAKFYFGRYAEELFAREST